MNTNPAPSPIAPRDRHLLLDILRGAALFGILVMNMPSFSWTHWPDLKAEQVWPAWWDGAELWIARWFFSGKFNSLFSFLFGLGFTLQLARLARGGRSPAPVYLRKMAALLLIGLAHATLVWHGDILLTYVEVGLLLLLVRKASDKAILVLAFIALVAGPISSSVHIAVMTPAEFLAEEQKYALLTRLADAAYSHGSFLDATMARLRDLRESYADPWSYPWHGQMLGTALFGCFAGRRRYLTLPDLHRDFFKKVFVGSLAAGIAGVIAWSVLRMSWQPHELTFMSAVRGAVYSLQRPAIMIAYVSGFMLLVTAGRVPRWTKKLAFAGRMPLTNYLSQSLICTTFFYAHGLGFYNKCGPAFGFALAVAIYSVQVELSAAWLRTHAYGPVEWLWRAMTYGRAPGTTVVALWSPVAEDTTSTPSVVGG